MLKLLIVAASLVQLTGSKPVGSGVVVLGLWVQAQCLGHRSLAAPWHVGSSQTSQGSPGNH